MKRNDRLSILSNSEIDELYGIPNFNDLLRSEYFALKNDEQNTLDTFRDLHSKLHFILALGYFKAKKVFPEFNIRQYSVRADANWILKHHFPTKKLPKEIVSKRVHHAIQNQILSLTGHQFYHPEQLAAKTQEIVHRFVKPIDVFREIVAVLEDWKHVLPGYTALQLLISSSLASERRRLSASLTESKQSATIEALDNLLETDESFANITALKKDAKDFSHGQMKKEINKHIQLKELYDFAKSFLPTLDISNDCIKYYASLIEHYSLYKIRRMDIALVHFYLLCYVFTRFRKINDNLVKCFIYLVKNYHKKARDAAKEEVYQANYDTSQNISKAGETLSYYADDSITNEIPFGDVRAKVFKILSKEEIMAVSQLITKKVPTQDDLIWEQYCKIHSLVVKNVRPLFKVIDFNTANQNSHILKTVRSLKTAFEQGKSLETLNQKSKLSLDGLTKEYRRRIKTDNHIDIRKYEFAVYRRLVRLIENQEIFCTHSINFRSLEDELVSQDQWANKDEILKELSIPKLLSPAQKRLGELKEELEPLIFNVNHRILNGDNQHIKITEKNDTLKWSLPYKKKEDTANNTVYSALAQVSVGEVLHFVNEQCGYIKAFSHIQPRYAKSNADTECIVALIIAHGTNHGLFKMARISDKSLNELQNASKSFIRLECLRNANDVISNATANLPIFEYWNIAENILHSSIDGQKFETKHHTIKSRYAPKYFGLNKGIVADTMIANHIPINAKVIGANEHESHYLFDLLYNNTTDINPDILSGDMATVNQLNFGLLDLIDKQFAPWYTKINERSESIVGFHEPAYYRELLIKPNKQVNQKLIVEEWDACQRIWASLLMKETNQYAIVKNLSTHAKHNKTKLALWEYDNILRSIHTLKFIDDVEQRQDIRRALNRSEGYHQLKRSVSLVNDSKVKGTNDIELDIWNECARLITNAIIHYNAIILSRLMERLLARGDKKSAEIATKLSPVAWRHINLFGKYEFRQDVNRLSSISDMIERLDYAVNNPELFEEE